jgi:hypothetical protein
MVVTYDNGVPDNIDIRQNIPRGEQSRVIDLRAARKRNVRGVEFCYDNQGILNGQENVTVFSMK